MNRAKTARILEELVAGCEISDFSKEWIKNSGKDEATVRQNYKFLKQIGFSDDRIASHMSLLGKGSELLEKNYRNLVSLGLSNKKIVSRAELLESDSETIQENYENLRSLGLPKEKINYHAELLTLNPKNIRKVYQHHVGLVNRSLLLDQPQLLGVSSETLEANVQWLYSLGMDYNNAFLLGTTPQTKRKKMAWMLRELYDYHDLSDEDKAKARTKVCEFVKENPVYLVRSISVLEGMRNKLREKIAA